MKKLLLTALVGLSLTAFAEPQTLKYASFLPATTSNNAVTLPKVKAKLEAESGGALSVEYYFGGTLGAGAKTQMRLVQNGVADCGGAFIYALFSREKNGAKFRQGARNGAGLWGVKVCGVVQLGAARNCAVCAVLLQIYLHCLRFKCARLIAFEAGFIPAFFVGVIRGSRRRRRRLGRRFGRLRVRGWPC